MIIYVLSDQPNNFRRENLEAIITAPTIIRYLDQHPELQTMSANELNRQLMGMFRRYNPRYLPISGREFVNISRQHPEINQLIGLHKRVYQMAIYKHLPVYLRKIIL